MRTSLLALGARVVVKTVSVMRSGNALRSASVARSSVRNGSARMRNRAIDGPIPPGVLAIYATLTSSARVMIRSV